MSRRVTPTEFIHPKGADLLRKGFAFVAQQNLIPNLFATIRWGETKYAANPFVGHQRLIERFRKMSAPEPPVYFWCRECERFDAVEHSHIAIRLPNIGAKLLQDKICKWVSPTEAHTVLVKKIGDREHCNGETLITLYFLKGLSSDRRADYGIADQYKAQGKIFGKRVGVSHFVSQGIRGMEAAE